jgi:hypothetical protein
MPYYLELLENVSKGVESGKGNCRAQEKSGFGHLVAGEISRLREFGLEVCV